MTAQINDTFIHKQKRYDLIGHDGEEIFNPNQFGMTPTMMHTACYRGFYATYSLTQKNLYVTKLTLSTENNTYIKIEDHSPDIDEHQATYKKLRVKIPYTGRIRLARGFISDKLVQMGFQKPSSYRTVLDFKLDNGKVIEMKDRSEDAAMVRHYLHTGISNTHINLIKKIDASFKMDMGFE